MPPLERSLRLPVLPDEPASPLRHWTSLEERRTGAPEDPRWTDEFPPGASVLAEPLQRRGFLKLLGASAAAGGLSACFQSPPELILPFSRQPVEMTPGDALHYASAWILDGIGAPVLVTSREGRPIKVEGNPDHPASLGGTGPIEQAAVHQLYDRNRARQFRLHGDAVDAQTFLTWIYTHAGELKSRGGEGLGLLLEPSASPTRQRMLEELRAAFPRARVAVYSPAVSTFPQEGAAMAFGRPLDPVYQLGSARALVSLGLDLLYPHPRTLRAIRDFAATREPGAQMSRLYVAESHLTVTGGFADHRLRLAPSRMSALLGELVRTLAEQAKDAELRALAPGGPLSDFERRFVRAAAKDLWTHRGRSLLVVGEGQPPLLHALAHACNVKLGNVGQTVRFIDPLVTPAPASAAQLKELTDAIGAGQLRTLVITAYNPVYSAPRDLAFDQALARVPDRIYLGYHEDETAAAANHFAPCAHPFEAWGDARAADGTCSIVQPLIAPLFKGISELELLAPLTLSADARGHDLVKSTWQERSGTGPAFQSHWEDWLVQGFIAGTQAKPVEPRLQAAPLVRAIQSAPPAEVVGLALELVPDLKIHDGRFADTAWLQELGDPITKLSWDNAALVSPATAQRLGLAQADWVRLQTQAGSLEVPVWLAPGQAEDTLTLALGYGHRADSESDARVGFNAYRLRGWRTPWIDPAVTTERLDRPRHAFATVQHHWRMEGRDLALEKTLGDFQAHPHALAELRKEELALYQEKFDARAEYKWAMAVDLNRCTGCTACVVACSIENNIPTVGQAGVLRSREMHWIRVDRYFTGDEDNPGVITQPMFCQHCEAAPCEYVCPVDATVHSDEGLNQQVYNRCIGTRYCSNNCPYKVRRFNFFDYHADVGPTGRMMENPDVTVRARGVIEKCTYCVQRIERARIATRRDGRRIEDGTLQTACQQACPTQALTFGSLTDEDGKVSRLHRDDRRYDVLGELGTRPRTAYLVRIKNPNPELA